MADAASRLKRVAPWLGLLAFSFASVLLYRELRAIRYDELLSAVASLRLGPAAAALALVVAAYAVVTGYDTLAFFYLRRALPYRQIALPSFIAYAFSNALGFPLFTGTPIRFRLYTALGIPAEEVSKLVAFCFLSFNLGLAVLAGAGFLFDAGELAGLLGLSVGQMRLAGAVLMAAFAGYLAAGAFLRRPLRLLGVTIEPPRPPVILAQLGISVADWTVTAAVLYVLLPQTGRPGYLAFLAVFLIAQSAGFVSQVPGGLGVFDTVVLVALTPRLEASAVLAALVVFRSLYYLLPLIVGATLLSIHELRQNREGIDRLVAGAGRWGSAIVPQVLALDTFLGGALLFLSGSLPTPGTRLGWLNQLIPLPVIELSHLLGSLVGISLILLARGLQRRVDAAYYLTLWLLGAGIGTTLLRGWNLREAALLGLMLVALLPCRREFYRHAALTRLRWTPGWAALVGIVLVAGVALTLFSHRQVDYSSQLWWQFALRDSAPRAMRAVVGGFSLVFLFALHRLLRSSPPEPGEPTPEEIETAGTIARQAPVAMAQLVLLGDKRILFNRQRTAFLMYGISERSWVALGEPVGAAGERAELAWTFRELADRHEGRTVFYQVPASGLALYVDLGLTFLHLGETGRVPLAEFSLEGGRRRDLRQVKRRVEEKEGGRFELVPADAVPPLLGELRAISDAWLAEKQVREKGFSLGFFHQESLSRQPVAVVRSGGRIVAFANVLVAGGGEELTVDLMRSLPEAPYGTMDYIFLSLMLWGREQGYRHFSLGMAPLSGLETHELAPVWNRIGGFIYRHGEHFYNFQGLRRYKEKFDPVWEPRYLAAPGGIALPKILLDVAGLIGGGLTGVVTR